MARRQELALAREGQDRGRESLALIHLGETYYEIGAVGAASALYEQALALAREVKHGKADGGVCPLGAVSPGA